MQSIENFRLSDKINYFTKNSLSKEIGSYRIKTGFDKLDNMLGGGIATGLTVLGAASGLGKSTFVLQMAENISANGTAVLFFSLEMGTNMIAAKSVSRQMFIQSKKDISRKIGAIELTNPAFTNKLKHDAWKSIEKSREVCNERSKNLYIIDNHSLNDDDFTAEGIYDIVSNFVQEHKDECKPLVIVDYLQILKANKYDNKGDRQSVENCIHILSKIHLKLKVPLILISSLSRASYNQKVQQDSFKETGGIEYSADVLLGLSFCNAPNDKTSRQNKFDINAERAKLPREVEINFLKQRYGRSGADCAIKFNYYAKYDYFEESSASENKKAKPKTNQNTTEEFVKVRDIYSGEIPVGEVL